jgi:hypothetical protein
MINYIHSWRNLRSCHGLERHERKHQTLQDIELTLGRGGFLAGTAAVAAATALL